jgi:hypothetical protein
MSRPVSSTLKTASKPALKNPLRASTMPLLAPSAVSDGPESPGHAAAAPAPEVTAQQLRRMQISEFSAWLRTQTNKHHRPFQEETIRGYAETARALDLWMAVENIDGDFTACSVDVLNTFFAAYRNAHSQGGTNTRQRNLHHLFKWLALRYDHPDPWTDDMVRYGPVTAPHVLAHRLVEMVEGVQDVLLLYYVGHGLRGPSGSDEGDDVQPLTRSADRATTVRAAAGRHVRRIGGGQLFRDHQRRAWRDVDCSAQFPG